MLRWERVTHHGVLDKCRLNLLPCCLFCRKWSKRWPIGWWGSFGGPFSPPPCHRPNWIFMEAGRPRRSSLEPGWPKSYTLSGAQDPFKHVSHWLWALYNMVTSSSNPPNASLPQGLSRGSVCSGDPKWFAAGDSRPAAGVESSLPHGDSAAYYRWWGRTLFTGVVMKEKTP